MKCCATFNITDQIYLQDRVAIEIFIFWHFHPKQSSSHTQHTLHDNTILLLAWHLETFRAYPGIWVPRVINVWCNSQSLAFIWPVQTKSGVDDAKIYIWNSEKMLVLFKRVECLPIVFNWIFLNLLVYYSVYRIIRYYGKLTSSLTCTLDGCLTQIVARRLTNPEAPQQMCISIFYDNFQILVHCSSCS